MQVEEFLESNAQRWPEKTALICGTRRLTYGEVERECNRLAHGLRALGLLRGDRVAVCLENTVEAAISVFAILKAGGVLMLLHPTTKPEKLEYLLNHSRASIIISSDERLQ